MLNLAVNKSYRAFKLNLCELMVYGYINSFFVNDKNAFISQKRLAQDLNYSLAQVKRAKKSLINKGLLVISKNRNYRYFVPCMDLDLVKSYLQPKVSKDFNLEGYINSLKVKQKPFLKLKQNQNNEQAKKINAIASNLSTGEQKTKKGTMVPLELKTLLKLIYEAYRGIDNLKDFDKVSFKEFIEYLERYNNPIAFNELCSIVFKWFKAFDLNDESVRFTIKTQSLALFKAKDPTEIFYFIDNGSNLGLFNEPFEEIKKPMPFLFLFTWLPIIVIKFSDLKVNDLFTEFVKNYGFYFNQSFNGFDEIIKHYIDLIGTQNGQDSAK